MKDLIRRRALQEPGASLGASARPGDAVEPLFLATYAPRPCGIATFTQDLADSVDRAAGAAVSRVIAIDDGGAGHEYNGRVIHVLDNRDPHAYARAAEFANASDCDVVSIQHEYGLYPGEWGEALLAFVDACEKPMTATLHTLAYDPPPKARHVLGRLCGRCERVVVMARTGIDILGSEYEIPSVKVAYIPHGVHRLRSGCARGVWDRLIGLGRPLILTCGLLSESKGVEYMIEGLPAVLRRHPRATYLIAGRTHPNVKARQGEQYREALKRRATALGIQGHVRFDDRFLPLNDLLAHLGSADVVVTPYIGRDQITSGTLAYAVAAGAAVVATPYLYARELALTGAVLLANFRSPESLGRQVLRVLDAPGVRTQLQQRARQIGKTMAWPTVGRQYYSLLEALSRPVVETPHLHAVSGRREKVTSRSSPSARDYATPRSAAGG